MDGGWFHFPTYSASQTPGLVILRASHALEASEGWAGRTPACGRQYLSVCPLTSLCAKPRLAPHSPTWKPLATGSHLNSEELQVNQMKTQLQVLSSCVCPVATILDRSEQVELSYTLKITS